MTPNQFIENELIQIERKAERWIGAIKNQLALPAEQRVTIFSSEQMEAEILNNPTWLAFVRSVRERFQVSLEIGTECRKGMIWSGPKSAIGRGDRQ